MPLDMNDPDTKAAIEAAATKIAQDTIKDKYIPVEEISGLKNKNEELIGKLKKNKERYGDISDDEISEIRRLKQAKEQDEFVRLVTSGKTEEARALATAGVTSAWDSKYGDLSTQFEVAQGRIGELEADVAARQEKVIAMQKRQLLKDITSGDDSFRKDHFDEFYAIYQNNVQIDEEGNAIALEKGKPKLNTDGQPVSFKDLYSERKASNGLFWNGGSGSGGTGGGAVGVGNDPSKWSSSEKHEYIKQNGRESYAKLLKNISR